MSTATDPSTLTITFPLSTDSPAAFTFPLAPASPHFDVELQAQGVTVDEDVTHLVEHLATMQVGLLGSIFEEFSVPDDSVPAEVAHRVPVAAYGGGRFAENPLVRALSAGSRCETLANAIIFGGVLFSVATVLGPYATAAQNVYTGAYSAACTGWVNRLSHVRNLWGSRTTCEVYLATQRTVIHELYTFIFEYMSASSALNGMVEAYRKNSLAGFVSAFAKGSIILPKTLTQEVTRRVCYGVSLTGAVAPRDYPPPAPLPQLEDIIPQGAQLKFRVSDGRPYYILNGKSTWCDKLPGWRREFSTHR